MQEFAAGGHWRNVFKLTDSIKYSETDERDAFFFVVRYWRVLALVKLRMHKNASDDLVGLNLSHPNCLFDLKLLHATVPCFTSGFATSLDLLYILLNSLLDPKERRRTQLTIVAVLIKQNDLQTAIEVTRQISADEESMTLLMMLYLELGDLTLATKTFEDSKSMLEDEFPLRFLMNQGLLSMAKQEFDLAREKFDQIIALSSDLSNPNENLIVSATNNRAVCLVFAQDLNDAVSLLEESLIETPAVFLNETLVQNVFTLLDLQSDAPANRKAVISKLIAANADDAFDVANLAGFDKK